MHAKDVKTTDHGWAFGSPEGDRSQLHDPLADFVEFRGPRFQSGLGMDPADRKVRVIVGRKGAGKTLYLRRLQVAADRENGIYADDWQTRVFRNEYVLRMLDWYGDSTAVERWEEVWRCSILRSVISHLLGSTALATSHVPRLRQRGGSLIPDFDEPESIYTQVSDIVGSARHRGDLDSYLGHRGWFGIERAVADALADTRPMFFYLDALDEKFEHAPRHWLLCQLGLFRAVTSFLRSPRLGGKLHIVIGIRDIVFSSTQVTEHATKFVETQAIRMLDWDRPAIEYFLEHKLQGLGPSHLMEPDATDSMQRWLGRVEIENEARGHTENLKDYLLRHTRLIPRDVVVLGNKLCDLVAQAHHEGQPFIAEYEIREVVRQAARLFGDEELRITANHLTAEAMPQNAAAHGYSDFYTGDLPHGQEFQQLIAEHLKQLLATLQYDRFSYEKLLAFRARADELLDSRANAVDILWQHGILGYIDGSTIREGRVVFYSATREDRLSLPQGKKGYALHPIMIDAIDELRGVGRPVYPYSH